MHGGYRSGPLALAPLPASNTPTHLVPAELNWGLIAPARADASVQTRLMPLFAGRIVDAAPDGSASGFADGALCVRLRQPLRVAGANEVLTSMIMPSG